VHDSEQNQQKEQAALGWDDLAGLDTDADSVVESVLRARLALVAQERGLLDVAYRTVDTAVGEMLLAATEVGVLRLAFAVEGFDQVLDTLARKVSPRVLRAPARLDRLAFEVEEYLTGSRRSFDLPLDLTLTTGFRREVVRHLPEIPYGRTATYTEVAALAGSPRAVRAVGTACAKNPLPLVVPCHRVVRSDGTTGQYAGGPAAKRWLLELEAAS
jgi:methylated-DNA-[protein]-cysteine S-methyltransferase